MPSGNEKVNPNQPKNSPWGSVASLAGKMGQLGGKATAFAGAVRDKTFEQLRQPALNARRKEALEFFVNNKDDIMGEPGFGTYEPEPSEQQRQLIEEFKEKSEGLWSRRFAEELCKASQSNHGLGGLRGNSIPYYGDAWKFVKKYDMPVSIVLENKDLYDGMVASRERIGSGKLSEIYQTMSRTEEGKEKFQHDFIESHRYREDLVSGINSIYANEPFNEGTMSDLKLLKQYGVCMFEGNDCWQVPSYDKRGRERAVAGTEFLIQNHLFSGSEYGKVINDILLEPNRASRHNFDIMTIASKSGITPKGKNPDVEYWGNVYAKSGENKLKTLLEGNPLEQQEKLDFSEPPVMRLFARSHMDDYYKTDTLKTYQNPKFREALRNPATQETIMQEIERNIQHKSLASESPPAPFLMLVQDRSILDGMRERGEFDKYPKAIEMNDAIKRASEKGFTEKERLELCYGREQYDGYFDEQGEPNDLWYANVAAANGFVHSDPFPFSDHEKERIELFCRMRGSADKLASQGSKVMKELLYSLDDQLSYWQFFDGSGNLKPEFYHFALQKGDYAFLANQDKNETGFDKTTNAFLKAYNNISSSKIVKEAHTPEERQEIISKYFDTYGPKPEFWQTSFDSGDISFLIKQDEETWGKMGLDNVSTDLLTAYINNRSSKKNQSFNDFILDASELSKEERRQKGLGEASDAILDKIFDLLDSEESSLIVSNRFKNITSLFDKNTGIPNAEFWQASLDAGDFSLLAKHDSGARAIILGFDETTNAFLDYYRTVKDSTILEEAKTHNKVREVINQYFTPDGPKPEFWQDSLAAKNFGLLISQDEETRRAMGFDEVTNAFLDAYEKLRLARSTIIKNSATEEIIKYFDADGPKPEFWQDSFEKGDFNTAAKYKRFTDDTIFDEKHSVTLEEYNSIQEWELRDKFRVFMVDHFDSIPIETIDYVSNTLNRLSLSNAEEISEHYAGFADAILSSVDTADGSEIKNKIEEKTEKIESIFIKNNLPYTGKIYHCFRALYPIGDKPHRAKKELERGAFKNRAEAPLEIDSPPRTIGEYRRIINSKDSIIFGDLLKASLGSNNRDMRQYLQGLKFGASLAERVASGETEFSADEREALRVYRDHLSSIYNNLERSKNQPFVSTGDTIEDIVTLNKYFSPSARSSVPDRIAQSFGYMIGIRSCDDAINRMDRTVANADARNREAARINNFRLESGDLIKSFKVEFLGASLQNGCLCKEFLDGGAESDSTPLDTDLNILPDGLSGDISEGVDSKNAGAAFGSMSCMVVMKGDRNSGLSRFVMEGENGEYDPNRYEVWHNGGINYGIRTGFPSTEIDYIIHDKLGTPNGYAGDLERMKYEVVKNGFYIPIIDKDSGDIVFTPDDYDKMRHKLSGLNTFDGGKFLRADGKERTLVPSLALDSYTFPDGTTIESSREVIAKSQDNKKEVDGKRSAIIEEVINPVLQQFALTRKDFIDGDLTEGSAEVIDTGSTGRYSNSPGDGDFDFMMKLDKKITSDPVTMESIRRRFCDILGVDHKDAVKSGNIRAKNIKLSSLDKPVDIDITFNTKTNKVRYSTDEALKEFYSSMGKEEKEEVVANVVFAKRFLKKIEAYKPDRGDTPQGGLGGVGIENWILQNGGSFVAAAKEFMAVADECGDNFETFRHKYAVIDYGENHQGKGGNDNFVTHNMSKAGYDKMRQALRVYLDQLGA